MDYPPGTMQAHIRPYGPLGPGQPLLTPGQGPGQPAGCLGHPAVDSWALGHHKTAPIDFQLETWPAGWLGVPAIRQGLHGALDRAGLQCLDLGVGAGL